MRNLAKACAAALAITLAGTSIGFAQTSNDTVAPKSGAAPKNNNGCTPQERANETLQKSDQANAGVICPPEVDPGMKAPTPPTGDPAVIPPPGSPGGNPNVQPK